MPRGSCPLVGSNVLSEMPLASTTSLPFPNLLQCHGYHVKVSHQLSLPLSSTTPPPLPFHIPAPDSSSPDLSDHGIFLLNSSFVNIPFKTSGSEKVEHLKRWVCNGKCQPRSELIRSMSAYKEQRRVTECFHPNCKEFALVDFKDDFRDR